MRFWARMLAGISAVQLVAACGSAVVMLVTRRSSTIGLDATFVVQVVWALMAAAGLLLGAKGTARRGERVGVGAGFVLLFAINAAATFALLTKGSSGQGSGAIIGAVVCAVMTGVCVLGLLAVIRMPPDTTDEASVDDRRGARMMAAGFAALFGVIFVVMLGVVRSRTIPPHVSDGTRASGQLPAGATRTFEDLNFRWQPPPAWEHVDPASIGANNATLVARRFGPEVWFMVLTDVPDNDTVTSEALADLMIAGLRRQAELVEVIDRKPAAFSSVAGARVVSVVDARGLKLRYVHHVGVHDGMAYQLVVWGESVHGTSIDDAAVDVIAGFEVIEGEPPVTPGVEAGG